MTLPIFFYQSSNPGETIRDIKQALNQGNTGEEVGNIDAGNRRRRQH